MSSKRDVNSNKLVKDINEVIKTEKCRRNIFIYKSTSHKILSVTTVTDNVLYICHSLCCPYKHLYRQRIRILYVCKYICRQTQISNQLYVKHIGFINKMKS